MQPNFIRTYVSVDCVVFGFDKDGFSILLVEQRGHSGKKHNGMKLPGSLIYDEEDVEDAVNRVLFDLTGIKKMPLKQFKCFANPNRVGSNDLEWLDQEYQPNIDRLITIAFISVCKIDRKLTNISEKYRTKWCSITSIPTLPFDHNKIVDESLVEIQHWLEFESLFLFELLPRKFTISQLHHLFETLYKKKIDIRNFHKKIISLPYIIPLNEKEKGVSHRAARYYKFDLMIYKKLKANI